MTSHLPAVEKLSLQSWDALSSTPERYWAFYVRVTSDESVKKDLSIPNQCRRAIEIAKLRGWDHYRIYVEPMNVSAELWTDKRPAFKELLDDVATGRIIGICARHTDRLWRNNEVLGKLISVLRPQGVELWDFNSRFEYKSAHGRFSLQVLGAASELEVGLVAERIREMKRGKALKGKTSGGPPPFGYTSQSHRKAQLIAERLSPDDAYRQACIDFPVGKTWYVNEDETAIVRLIFELYTSAHYRYGSRRIARHLNAMGHRGRTGLRFAPGTVMKILNNPAYAGYTSFDEAAYDRRVPSNSPRYKQKLYTGEHLPLITPAAWQLAQDIKAAEGKIARVRMMRRTHIGTVPTFSLTGILKCPQCGGNLNGRSTNHKANGEQNYRYYFCANRYNGGAEACNFRSLSATIVQGAVWNWLHEILGAPEFVTEYVERIQKRLQSEQPDGAKHLQTLRKQRDTIKGSIAKYFRVFEELAEPDVAVLDRVRELRTELQMVEMEIAKLEAHTVPIEQKINPERVRYYLAKLRGRIAEHSDYQRAIFQELKRTHDLNVRISPTGQELTVSLALPREKMLGDEASEKRIASVLAASPDPKGRQILRDDNGSKTPFSQSST
jgi:site-specific DNA recombinase